MKHFGKRFLKKSGCGLNKNKNQGGRGTGVGVFDNFINHHVNGAVTVGAHLAFCLKAVESDGGGLSVQAAA